MQWNRLTRVTPPADTVVSIDTAKAHLQIDHDDDDELIEALIRAAEAYVEGPKGIGIALLPQTWRLSLDRFSGSITIPLGPVREIVSITADGETVDPASYAYDLDSTPLKIVPNGSWPSVSAPGAVKVTFTVGYDADDVPWDIRAAILLLIAHLHRNREATSDKAMSEVPFGVQSVLDRYRVLGLG